MSRYYIGLMFCIVIALAYPAFRGEATAGLRHRKIRKRDIRQKQKGAMNFWFYTELEQAYGLGKYGMLLRIYPIVVGSLIAFHLSLGWIEALAKIDMVLVSLTALYLSIMILSACIRRNRRLFGSSLVLWGTEETNLPVRPGNFLLKQTKNGRRILCYSSVFDLIFTALPLAFPAMMGCFTYMGW